ncbi:MAG: chemotaxis protein CheW [Brevinema sp.]
MRELTVDLDNQEELEQDSSHEDELFHAVTFSLDTQIYAINILYIRDIVMSKPIYCIPNSNPFMLGVTNIRGEITPVYSLKKILSKRYQEEVERSHDSFIDANEDEYFITLKIDSYFFALSVEQIHKNLRATSTNYSESDYLEKWAKDTIFSGIITEENQNILMLDILKMTEMLKNYKDVFQN